MFFCPEGLVELEHNREGVGNLGGLAVLLAGGPLRGSGDDADSFGVQGRIYALEYLHVLDLAVLIDDETEEYLSIEDEELLDKLFDIFKKKYEGDIKFE